MLDSVFIMRHLSFPCLQAFKTLPELRHYYMGFYIHTCPKVALIHWLGCMPLRASACIRLRAAQYRLQHYSSYDLRSLLDLLFLHSWRKQSRLKDCTASQTCVVALWCEPMRAHALACVPRLVSSASATKMKACSLHTPFLSLNAPSLA